ncbi:MAG: APC family permease [Fimbriimonas ginsengisoli]|uniref:APC family permease n=1 Tax=Fimbriimonas ginsengisoli TaxID=1005039 RepID=A0A931LR34_FIMGI|nr:APC family permease [Fimbriimonas ginsengisoli]
MADRPRGLNLFQGLRRALIGAPIATSKAHQERLSPFLGLPIFSSDALSSVAYATEAILGILVLYSVAALSHQIWISLAICLLIVIVAISYMQTIHAYPGGGGSYVVASENLGPRWGLLAGAALLVDYVLTVSVSVAAGGAAIISAFPSLHQHLVLLSIAFVAIVAWANLRGVRESGALFAVPTYGFILGMFAALGVGLYKAFAGPAVVQQVFAVGEGGSLIGHEASFAVLYIVLRAFAAGCTALTGIEAVSNAVQAFRPPEARNASITLRWMAAILAVMFLGTGIVASHLPVLTLHASSNPEYRTVVSQIASWSFGDRSVPFYYLQFATALILILAANTAFAGFPRLASLLARDGYLPRPLARLGDRLVFHNGILFLAIAAGAIIWYFHGALDQLLPLYAVGVFTAFSLSQAGMVVHWWRLKEGAWRRSALINGFGGVLTIIVTGIILVTKFVEGAWIVSILLVAQYALFRAIRLRYASISRQLEIGEKPPTMPREHVSLLLVPRVHRGILAALEYARLLGLDCRAVHVALNVKALPTVMELWDKYGEGIPLEVLATPYRSLIQPVLDYIDRLVEERPDLVVTVIVPEAIASGFFHKLLQENVANQLKQALGSRRNVVVTNVRYFLD